MKPRIYIAGPMTGYENFNREAFNSKADDLRIKGFTPLNPAILPDDLTQGQYMDICFAMIRAADGIHLLKGWRKSKGALAELAYAEKLGLAITKDGSILKIDIFNTDKKYSLITADPPWKYGSKGPRGGKFGALDYSDMTIAELKELPVASLSSDTCALLMWFTGSFAKEAIEVCEAWGFKFIRIDTVWKKVKPTGGKHAACGPWGMSDAEFVLLGTKGKACSMQKVRNQYVVQEAFYTGKHSEKPESILELFDARFGDVPRLELFSRREREGWDFFGDEV